MLIDRDMKKVHVEWLAVLDLRVPTTNNSKLIYRATLNFRNIKVALNPMYRIFLNFAKSCILSCLSKVDNIKKFRRAVFEL